MAKHQGQLKVNYSGSSSGSKAAGLLRGAVTAAAGAAVSAATAGVTGGAAPVDTDSKSGSASGTPKAGASAPSPAAGGKCGGPRATVSLQPLRALQRSLLDLALPRLSLSLRLSLHVAVYPAIGLHELCGIHSSMLHVRMCRHRG